MAWAVSVRGGRASWNDLVCAACCRPFVKGEWTGTLVEPDPAGGTRAPVPCSGRLHHACAVAAALVVNAEHQQALAARDGHRP